VTRDAGNCQQKLRNLSRSEPQPGSVSAFPATLFLLGEE
jgi:hypothetical protein